VAAVAVAAPNNREQQHQDSDDDNNTDDRTQLTQNLRTRTRGATARLPANEKHLSKKQIELALEPAGIGSNITIDYCVAPTYHPQSANGKVIARGAHRDFTIQFNVHVIRDVNVLQLPLSSKSDLKDALIITKIDVLKRKQGRPLRRRIG